MTVDIHHTTCPMDCPDACALEIEVSDGKVTKIGGGTDHPDTAGFICSKVAGFGRRLEGKERVLYPQRRVGPKGMGQFERISWEEAIDEVATRFGEIRERWGGEAILPFHYGGSNGLVSDELVDELYFARLGASRIEKTVCAVPTTEVAKGMYGKMPTVAFEDFEHARCIVIWGANPKASNIHLVPYLRRAKEAGAFIAVVDPRSNFSEAEVDLHLPVRPGTDLPIALAMIGHWEREGSLDREFLSQYAEGLDPLLERARGWSMERAAEVAGVEVADLVLLAERLVESSPALVRCGWGLERNRNGGQAVAAILAIPSLLGKFGVRGGGYAMSNSGAKKFRSERLVGNVKWETRSLNMSQLGRHLIDADDPPIKSLFVYNANPVASFPDQNRILAGLAREDLYTVVCEQVATDTVPWADLVLPAVTFLEGWDLKPGYGSYVVGAVTPAIEPMGEARTNHAIFCDLAAASGLTDEAFSWSDEQVVRRAIGALEYPGGPADPDRLIAGSLARFDFAAAGIGSGSDAQGSPVQFETVFPQTKDGRIHLTPAVLGDDPFAFVEPESDLPLALISPADGKMISSTFGESNCPQLKVDVHPEDARARGIERGDRVRVFNGLGEVICIARPTSKIRPGVVSMPKGAWRYSSINGSTSTALCPDHVNVVGGGACFNDARVEVEKV